MLDQIKSILYDGYRVRETNKFFCLTETGREASCRLAKFEAKNDYLVYKFDKVVTRDSHRIRNLFPSFNAGNASCMCDYIIFYKKNDNRLFSVVCNMKSKHKGNNYDQIMAGNIFSNFIFETVKRLYPTEYQDIDLKIVNVLFSSVRLYPNRAKSENAIINLLSNDEVKESFIFENKCR